MSSTSARGLPPLVLLHGFTGAPASFDRVRANLDPSIEIFAPTLAGHAGASLSIPTFVAEIDRLAAEIGERCGSPCHLGGYSLGGRLALGLALEHPNLVASLTLISTHPGLTDDQERRARIAADEEQARFLEHHGIGAFIERWQAQPLFASQGTLPPDVLAEQSRIRSLHRVNGLALALRVLGLGMMPDYSDRLSELTVPLSLITGQLDAKFVSIGEHMRALHPSARWICIPNAGHNVVLEAPRQLAEWLSRIVTSASFSDDAVHE